MFRVFEGTTADAVWQKAATALIRDGRLQRSRAGSTRELLRVIIGIENPRQRWVYSRLPAINPAFAIAETIWILLGRDDAALVNYFNRSLPRYAGTTERYYGAYGRRLRAHFGVDQLRRACEVLRSNPESRQAVLQIWDPAADLPHADGRARASDIPCNLCSLLKVRDGKLELTQVLRSNDLFRGLPYNIVQFTTIQEILAGWLGLDLGRYGQLSDSLHLYETDLFQVSETQAELIHSNDDLAVPEAVFNNAMLHIGEALEHIIDHTRSADALLRYLDVRGVPAAYNNMLCMLVAEGARRRKSSNVAELALSRCSNDAYRHLWSAWQSRVGA